MSLQDAKVFSRTLAQSQSMELAKTCFSVWTQAISPFACIACTNNDLTYDVVPIRSLPPAPFCNVPKKTPIPIRDFNQANQIPVGNTEPLFGVHIWPDGDYYRGWWKLGERDGHGRLFTKSGDTYNGEWSEGLLNGQGHLILSSGSEYKGGFKNGLRHGSGRLLHRQHTYDGEWCEGRRHGVGREQFPNGVEYYGHWKENLPDGDGTLTFPNGDEYIGCFVSGQRHGYGKWISGKHQYEGHWANDKKDGFGTVKYSNGDHYEGEWRNGFKDGRGIYTWASVQIIKEDGVRYKFLPGDRFEGHYKRGKRCGPGTFYHNDGRVYDALWLSNCLTEKIRYRSEFGGKKKRILPNRNRNRAHQWGVEAVVHFLMQLTHNDKKIAQLVREHAITGHRLLNLTNEDLVQKLHLTQHDTRYRVSAAITKLLAEDALETFNKSDVRIMTELEPDHDEYIRCKSTLLRHMGSCQAFTSVQVLSIHKIYAKNVTDRWLKWKEKFASRPDRKESQKKTCIGFYTAARDYIDEACMNGIYPSLHKNNPTNEKDRWYGDPKRGVYITRTCSRSLQHLLPNVSIDSLDEDDPPEPVSLQSSSSGSLDETEIPSGPQDTVRIFDAVMVECIPGRSYQFQDFWQTVKPKPGYDSHLSKDGKEWFLFFSEHGQVHPLFKLKLLVVSSKK